MWKQRGRVCLSSSTAVLNVMRAKTGRSRWTNRLMELTFAVIPGHREAMSPESITTVLAFSVHMLARSLWIPSSREGRAPE
jgi:hypothetical protein